MMQVINVGWKHTIGLEGGYKSKPLNFRENENAGDLARNAQAADDKRVRAKFTRVG
ncbi:hypothetical protein NUACC21_22920 [Scytonema sp. NUACC21]